MNLTDNIAFELHEQWRKTRLNKNGTYEPRWKTIKDTEFVSKLNDMSLPNYIRKTDNNSYEIDIANVGYFQLSKDWQNENKTAAGVVEKIVKSGKALSIIEVGNIIHDEWLNRNSWAKGGELDVPFEQLPKEEQDKDIVQYNVALKMNQAQKVDNDFFDEYRMKNGLGKNNKFYRLEDYAEILETAGKLGINVYFEFNNQKFYSLFDTVNTCFLKAYGMTQEQVQAEKAKLLKLNKQEIENSKEKIEHLYQLGKTIIYPEKNSKWQKCVNESIRSPFVGSEIVGALKVMEALDKGETIEKATQIAYDNAQDSDASFYSILGIVLDFSKRGPEFFRANVKTINADMEKVIQNIENENKNFQKVEEYK